MCGIVGIIKSPDSLGYIESAGKVMLSKLKHRGPDSEGFWISPSENVFLGHARLAIHDLSPKGHQPMNSVSQKYWIVFNGEIYNFQELAVELRKSGYSFSGHSDTEVLLAAVDQWGLDNAVKRFVGMFAFVIWDIEKQTLTLCRDRIGEKPLYYGVVEEGFYFSSELKSIESILKSELTIDKNALSGFLKYGYINAPLSIYKGIFKLIPGTILTVGIEDVISGRLPSPVPYWNIIDMATQGINTTIGSEREAVDQLDTLLINTIKRQLIADVGVGSFLSGGIDSTLVSAIAQGESVNKIKTFTIGFHEKEYDESIYAKKIAEYIGSEHHEVFASSQDALNIIPNLHDIYDEPFADSSQIPTYLVSKIAKQHVTVCLSGDGGDELFAGYNRYMWLSGIWKKVESLPFGLRKTMSNFLSIPSPQFWDRSYSLCSKFRHEQNKHKLLGLKVQKIAGLLQKTNIRNGYDYLISYWDTPDTVLLPEYQVGYSSIPESYPPVRSFIEEAMYWDQLSYLPGDNLTKVDRASMSVSLETRLPLLSHEVLEYSWRLPMSAKVKGNNGKWVLRKVLERYVPNHLVERPKMGFSVPISKWLRCELREWAEDLLFRKPKSDQEIFRLDVLRKVWDEHIHGENDHSHRLWAVLMFLSWQDAR